MPSISASTNITSHQFKEAASPGTPATGYGRTYFGTDSAFHAVNDGGVDVSIHGLYTGGIALASQAANDLVYCSGAAQLARIAAAASSVLVTSAGNVPSLSTTLPNAVQDNITRTGEVVSGTWGSTVSSGSTIATTINTTAIYAATLTNLHATGAGLSVVGGSASTYALRIASYANAVAMTVLGNGNTAIAGTLDVTGATTITSTLAMSALGDLAGLKMTATTTGRPIVDFWNATTGNLGQLYFADDATFTVRRKLSSNKDILVIKDAVGTLAEGSQSCNSGAATTLFSVSAAGLYRVYAFYAGASAIYLSSATVHSDGSYFRGTFDNGAGLTLSLSGSNLQALQSSGGALVIQWVYWRISY